MRSLFQEENGTLKNEQGERSSFSALCQLSKCKLTNKKKRKINFEFIAAKARFLELVLISARNLRGLCYSESKNPKYKLGDLTF